MGHETDGRRKKVKGSMKEVLGKVAGIDHLEAEGAQEKKDGKVQEAIGRVQDARERAVDASKETPPAE